MKTTLELSDYQSAKVKKNGKRHLASKLFLTNFSEYPQILIMNHHHITHLFNDGNTLLTAFIFQF